MVPVMPADQSMAPVCFMDIVVPITVVPSILAELAPLVFCCTLRSAAIGSALTTPPAPLPVASPPRRPRPMSAPPTPQPTDTRVARSSSSSSSPPSLRTVASRRRTARTATAAYENEDGPRTSKGCGARPCHTRRGFRTSAEAQTAAGSSSTRRLRVRLASSGMPGPIVVASVAFLM